MRVGGIEAVSWAQFPHLADYYQDFLLAQLPGDISQMPRRKQQALAAMQGAAFSIRVQAYRAVTKLALSLLKPK